MKPKPLVIALAIGALFLAILLPPEAYPAGRMAVLLCATFAFFSSVIEQRISAAYLRGGVVLFSILLVHSLLLSVDLYRSLSFITVLWTYYCLIGFFRHAGFDPLVLIAGSLVTLTVVVSGYGLYQYFWGFDQLFNYIAYSGSSEIIRVPTLDRVATRRVFSTLALPGTLWGFLVVALPFHAALWKKSKLLNVILVGSASMLLVTGFLTRSFGFLLGLLALTAAWLLLHHRRMLWNRLTIVLLALAVLGGSFYSVRRTAIEGSNPAGLRSLNWISAWTIFAAHPLGTGLNTYGIEYPRYMLPGANETQFAHNTPLQMLSELGWFFILALLLATVILVRSRAQERLKQLSPYLLLGLVVWGVHNLVDIDVYFPSVGVLGAILIGAAWQSAATPGTSRATVTTATLAVMALVTLVFGGLTFVSEELQHRAQLEYEDNKLAPAVATLAQAKRLMPLNSSLYHDAGEIQLELSQKRHEPAFLEDARASFQTAIRLSPNKVGPHIGYGLCLSSTGQVREALAEVGIAQDLYPDSAYVASILRLMRKRLSN